MALPAESVAWVTTPNMVEPVTEMRVVNVEPPSVIVEYTPSVEIGVLIAAPDAELAAPLAALLALAEALETAEEAAAVAERVVPEAEPATNSLAGMFRCFEFVETHQKLHYCNSPEGRSERQQCRYREDKTQCCSQPRRSRSSGWHRDKPHRY